MRFNEVTEQDTVRAVLDELKSRGWQELSGITPGGSRADLMATDGNGTLMCIELKISDRSLHSGILQTLRRMQDDLSSAWPGRSVLVLATTATISARLKAALLTSGVVLLELRSLSHAPERIGNFVESLVGTQSHSQVDKQLALMNEAALAMDDGRWQEAAAMYAELLSRQSTVLGPAHPIVLDAKNRLASLRARSGEPAAARELYQELLSDQVRVLGPEHPNTFATRYNLAGLVAQMGDAPRAREMYQELLSDQVRGAMINTCGWSSAR